MSLIELNDTITIALSVKDRHVSAKWYKDMLGFESLYHADEAGWSELQTNTQASRLVLANTPSLRRAIVFQSSVLPILLKDGTGSRMQG